jgi:amidase
VSGGLVDFALGTDCGGSVRLPASYCGIYGIRPTDGRIADDGIIHLAKSFDTVGWFARTPTLLAQVDAVLSGEDGDPVMPREALIASDAFDLARDSVVTALLPALDRVSSAVRSTRTIQIGTDRLRGWMQDFRVIQGAEVWANHREWVLSVRPTFGPGIKERFEWAATIATEAVETATEHRRALAAEMQELLGDGAVLLIPTAPDIAPRLNTPPTELERFRADALSLLCVAGLAGLPQINLPLGVVQGCPIGLSIVGSRGSDRALLALATQLGN